MSTVSVSPVSFRTCETVRGGERSFTSMTDKYLHLSSATLCQVAWERYATRKEKSQFGIPLNLARQFNEIEIVIATPLGNH